MFLQRFSFDRSAVIYGRGEKKGKRACFLNLNPNEKKHIFCVAAEQRRLLVHKCPDLCNYAFSSDSFITGFCVGVGLRGWMCVPAAQISHSIESASFFFPLLNHLVPSFSSLSIPLVFPHACCLPLSLPIIPNLLSRPPSPGLLILPLTLTSIPARRFVNMASPSSWICVAPSGTASNLF